MEESQPPTKKVKSTVVVTWLGLHRWFYRDIRVMIYRKLGTLEKIMVRMAHNSSIIIDPMTSNSLLYVLQKGYYNILRMPRIKSIQTSHEHIVFAIVKKLDSSVVAFLIKKHKTMYPYNSFTLCKALEKNYPNEKDKFILSYFHSVGEIDVANCLKCVTQISISKALTVIKWLRKKGYRITDDMIRAEFNNLDSGMCVYFLEKLNDKL